MSLGVSLDASKRANILRHPEADQAAVFLIL
jgi:hypothetical protein